MDRKLGRKKANREHLLRNLVTSLVLYERITTTEPKAKEVKKVIDRIITIGKDNSINSLRQLKGFLFDENAAKKVLEVFSPRYIDRPGGFTKTFRVGPRLGDGAQMSIIEFISAAAETKKEAPKTKTKQTKENK